MIRNHRQYETSLAQRRRLLETRASYEAHPQGDPLAQSAVLSSVDTLLEGVNTEIAAYEALRSGAIREFTSYGLADLPDALVQARIAAGLTQKDLAERLGVSEQQIQRDEAGAYAKATLDRVRRVAEALDLEVVQTFRLHRPVSPP